MIDSSPILSRLTRLRHAGASVALIACAGFAVCADSARAAPPALDLDGVILIDQNRASFGNTTPGDAAGFPVTISRPGNYRLAGNLTVPNADTPAIQIAADNVTLDLNGFAILGPTDCSRFPCVGRGAGIGVLSVASGQTPRFNITVRNGTIQGMGSAGIILIGDSNLVERVTARGNGGLGIALFSSSEQGASVIRDSVVQRNSDTGIILQVGRASFNTASGNLLTGIQVDNGTASHNHINHNHFGLVMGRGNYYGNSFDDNSGGNSGGVNQGQNVCDGVTCPGAQF
jgi:hypothetical protein